VFAERPGPASGTCCLWGYDCSCAYRPVRYCRDKLPPKKPAARRCGTHSCRRPSGNDHRGRVQSTPGISSSNGSRETHPGEARALCTVQLYQFAKVSLALSSLALFLPLPLTTPLSFGQHRTRQGFMIHGNPVFFRQVLSRQRRPNQNTTAGSNSAPGVEISQVCSDWKLDPHCHAAALCYPSADSIATSV